MGNAMVNVEGESNGTNANGASIRHKYVEAIVMARRRPTVARRAAHDVDRDLQRRRCRACRKSCRRTVRSRSATGSRLGWRRRTTPSEPALTPKPIGRSPRHATSRPMTTSTSATSSLHIAAISAANGEPLPPAFPRRPVREEQRTDRDRVGMEELPHEPLRSRMQAGTRRRARRRATDRRGDHARAGTLRTRRSPARRPARTSRKCGPAPKR